MVLFLRKIMVVALQAGVLRISCEQRAGEIPPPVNAELPSISVQPVGGDWDVSKKDSFVMSVTASGNGILSYQWYWGEGNEGDEDGDLMPEKTSAVLTLKAGEDCASNGDYWVYVEVTNTISGDSDNKTASVTSNAVKITVTGNQGIDIASAQDLAKIGVDSKYPLSGTYRLTQNISLSNWVPIGDNSKPFRGVLIGGGKTITLNGFAPFNAGKPYLGIFGYVKGVSKTTQAAVRNLTIDSKKKYL